MGDGPVRILSLCSGAGGLDLGLRLALPAARTVCYVENDPDALRVLGARVRDGWLDCAPIWSDVVTFRADEWRGAVDLVLAGFPCQPFSTASRGRRVAHNLWEHIYRAVVESVPRIVFVENVQRAPIETAAEDLERAGYRVEYAPAGTAALGAWHDRVRWFAVAVADTDDAMQSDIAVHDPMACVSTPPGVVGWQRGPREVL